MVILDKESEYCEIKPPVPKVRILNYPRNININFMGIARRLSQTQSVPDIGQCCTPVLCNGSGSLRVDNILLAALELGASGHFMVRDKTTHQRFWRVNYIPGRLC